MTFARDADQMGYFLAGPNYYKPRSDRAVSLCMYHGNTRSNLYLVEEKKSAKMTCYLSMYPLSMAVPLKKGEGRGDVRRFS